MIKTPIAPPPRRRLAGGGPVAGGVSANGKTAAYQYQKHTYEIVLSNEITGQRRIYKTETSIGAEKPLLTVISDFLASDAAKHLLDGFQIQSITATNGRVVQRVGSKLISDVVTHYRKKYVNASSMSSVAEASLQACDPVLRLCKERR